ncbi:MAG: NAD-dependent epimerase/dehydratase family protein [Candidatus Binatia bacterium]
MRIFVTGASGFIGGAFVRAQRERHTLLAMSRSEASDATIRAAGGEPLRGALGAVEAAQLAGCEAVVHCAAHVEAFGARADFWRANVDGTQQLLDAARAAGVRRFVHVGTEAACFHGQDMVEIDETYPLVTASPYLYAETKAEAERRVLAANAPAAGFTTISVRPRLVWGPGDQTILPILTRMVREGRFAWMDGGRARTSTTHVANLVHALELALTRGTGGEAYFVTDGEDTTLRTFLTALLRSQHMEAPPRSLPGWLARGAAATLERVWYTLHLKGEPPLTGLAAGQMSRHCTIRIDKIRRDLAYAPVLLVADGLRELTAQPAAA